APGTGFVSSVAAHGARRLRTTTKTESLPHRSERIVSTHAFKQRRLTAMKRPFLFVDALVSGCQTDATPSLPLATASSQRTRVPPAKRTQAVGASTSPCSLAKQTQVGKSWIKSWSQHFPVERRGA